MPAGSAPATIAALARMRSKLDGVDLIVTLGGMGTTKAELEATLGTIAGKEPLVVLPGDLEDERAQQAALATLRAKGTLVMDGRQARWITGDGFALATIPGAGAVERLVAGLEGCAWRAGDVAKIYDELAGRPGLRVALLAEAPRAGTARASSRSCRRSRRRRRSRDGSAHAGRGRACAMASGRISHRARRTRALACQRHACRRQGCS